MSPDLIFAIAVGTLAGALMRILMSFKKKRVREAVAAQEALAAKEAQAARALAASTAPARKRKRRR